MSDNQRLLKQVAGLKVGLDDTECHGREKALSLMEEADSRVQAVEDECERQLATASEVEARHEKYINELEDERDALEVELSVQHKRGVAVGRATAATCKHLRAELFALKSSTGV